MRHSLFFLMDGTSMYKKVNNRLFCYQELLAVSVNGAAAYTTLNIGK